MKDIRSIHGRAMEFMRTAKQHLENRDKENYLRNMRFAYDLEKEAAFELLSNFESEPTRSVLFRSAANLAYNLGEYDQAEKLIYQALSGSPHLEIKNELIALKESVELAYGLELSSNDVLEYSYLNILRIDSVNLKVEPKIEKYSKAIVLDSIVDFLRNIQTSYKNFVEVNFRKCFGVEDYSDFEKTVGIFKKDSNLLMVDLKFQSFGVAIVADSSIMNYKFDSSSKFIDFKSTLFNDFKREVLYADLNSEKIQEEIGNKYSEPERSKIYSSIINSLDSKSNYKVSIADQDFKFKIKDLPIVSKKASSFFKPLLIKEIDEEKDLLIKRTMELTDSEGNKKTKLQTDYLSYAEFIVSISDIDSKEFDTKIYFREPYNIKIIFSENTFSIDDTFFIVYVESKDFKEIQKLYESSLIEKFIYLSQNTGLTIDEEEILEKMNISFLRS